MRSISSFELLHNISTENNVDVFISLFLQEVVLGLTDRFRFYVNDIEVSL